LVNEPKHTGSNRYTFDYGEVETASGAKFNCVMDGMEATEAMHRPDADAEAVAWRSINSSNNNHSCGRNVNLAARWVEDVGSGLWWMAYAVTRDVAPNEQLCSCYNGNGQRSGNNNNRYWHRFSSLKAAGVPDEHIVRCGCRTTADGLSCINTFAFDRRKLDPHLYPKTDVAAERAAAVAAAAAEAAAAAAVREAARVAAGRPPSRAT
jgi:hypothetical protein